MRFGPNKKRKQEQRQKDLSCWIVVGILDDFDIFFNLLLTTDN